MIGAYIPTAVVIHDREHGDFSRIEGCRGLDAPVNLLRYKDTFPEEDPYNSEIESLILQGVDDLIIQEKLLVVPTSVARLAVRSAQLSTVKRAVMGSFNEDFQYRELNPINLARLIHRI